MATNARLEAAKKASQTAKAWSVKWTSKSGTPDNATKIMLRESNERGSGSKTSTIKVNGNPTVGQARTATELRAENALARAAKVSAKTGENVQNIRSRIKTDAAKTSNRAGIIAARQKRGK